ncbi:MAG: transcription elongation factor GreA [Cytophagales bacterium]|nr:transcription elongation factor GreA [Cytophagales bacterium]MDW8384710.1 transcription elongation factor GreA [Flammeovirgaceae bacterium]
MSKVTYYTQEGYNKLRNRLQELKTKGRADISAQIAEARDKGDLSENAEYDAAKDAQGLLEMEIAKLEELLANARIIDESKVDTSKVSILTTVKIKNKANNALMEYTLVSEEEADLKLKKISVKSPIGAGLLGKKVGEIAEIKTPNGIVKLEVLEIKLGI